MAICHNVRKLESFESGTNLTSLRFGMGVCILPQLSLVYQSPSRQKILSELPDPGMRDMPLMGC